MNTRSSAEQETGIPSSGSRFWLGRPWWQGVGAIAGIIAILVSALLACTPENNSPPSSRTNIGSCNAGGDNSSVVCAPANQPLEKDGKPPKITVETIEDPCSIDWVSPLLPGQIKALHQQDPLNQMDDWTKWNPSVSGAPASPGLVRLMLEGENDRETLLTDIKIKVRERKPVMSGTVLNAHCGDEGAYRWLEADLDSEPVKVTSKYSPGIDYYGRPDQTVKPIKFP